ncbi:MAG: methyltransferase [Polyangiaceae bacterium]
MTPGDTTTDTLFGGLLRLTQPRRGYRFNVDALWLAEFATRQGRARRVLDLGAGIGALGLGASCMTRIECLTCVEQDQQLAELCRQNLERAAQAGRVLEHDLARGLPRALHAAFDLVLVNPPYFERGERRAARPERETARAGSLEPFLRAAAVALAGPRARAAFVYPARSLARFFAGAERHGLVPKRMALLHPFRDQPARLGLVELRRARPGGLVVEPALAEWERPGVPSAESARLTARRATART